MKKLLLTTIFLLVFTSSISAQQIKVFGCVVTKVDSEGVTRVCDTADKSPLFLPWLFWPNEWKYDEKGNPQSEPKVGQVVEAFEYEGGMFPIEPCDVRVSQRRLAYQSSAKAGQHPGFSIHERKDCAAITPFIKATVRRVQRKAN